MNVFVQPVILTVKQIDRTDQRFRLFQPEPPASLIDRLLLVQKTDRQYRVVDGFELLTDDLLPDRQVPAWCFPENPPILEILIVLVKIKQQRRPLNPLEIARVFQFARDAEIEDPTIAESLLPVIGLPGDPGIVRQYCALLSIREPLGQYLIAKKAPLKTWRFITSNFSETQHYLEMLLPLRPTLSLFEELVTHLYEIGRREHLSPLEIFEQFRWQEQLSTKSREPKERIEALRRAVYRRRYPTLSAHHEKVLERLASVALPENAELNFDDTFERKELRLEWSLSSSEDLKKMEKFCTSATLDKIRRLLDAL